MARPIAATPPISGSDAKRFIEATNNPKPFVPVIRTNSAAIEAAKKALFASVKKHN